MSRPERPIDRIAPDFAERWGADTPEEALRKAERAPSTTPKREQPRCRYCGSIRCRPKPGAIYECDHRVDSAYKCNNCGEHLDELAPPAAEAPDYDFENTDDTMTDTYSDRFEWIDSDDLADPADRGLTHPLAGVDDETLTELAIRAYRPWADAGPSYRDLGRVLPYGRAWVGDRVREWKRGGLRDVVADPTGGEHGGGAFEWVDEPARTPDPFEWVGRSTGAAD